MATIRELVVALRFDGDKAMKGLAKFGLAVDGVKAGLEIMAGAMNAARAATFGFVNDQTAAGDQIAKTARAMGVGAKEFQRLAFAAEQSGVPMTNLIKASQNLARNMRDAALSGGKGGFATALTEVGLEMKDLIGLSFEDKLGLIGEALQKLPTEAAKVAASQKLLGEEAGPKFASFLKLTTDEVQRLGDTAESLGIVMSDKALKAAEDYQGALTDLNAIVTGLKRSIGIGLAPQMKVLVNRFTEWIKTNNKLIRQKVNKMFDLVVKALSGGLDKLEGWVTSFIELAGAIFDIIDRLLKLSEAVGGVENAIKLAAVMWGVYTAAQALALSPLAIAAAAVLFLAAAFIEVESSADRAARAEGRFGKATGQEKKLSARRKKGIAGRLSRALETGNVSDTLIQELAGVSAADLTDIQRRAKAKTRVTLGGGAFGVSGALDVTGSGSPLQVKRASQIAQLIKLEKESISSAKKNTKKQIDEFDELIAKTNLVTGRPSAARLDLLSDLGAPGPAGAKAKAEQGAIDEAEILKLISIAGRTGQSLTGLIGKRRIEGGTPPIISATFITNNVDVDAPITIEGVPSDTAEEAAERFTEMIAEHLNEKIQEATEELAPVMAR